MGCGCTRTTFPVTTSRVTAPTPEAKGQGLLPADDKLTRQKSYNVIVKKDEILVRFDRKGEVMDYYLREGQRPKRLQDMHTAYSAHGKLQGETSIDGKESARRLQLDYVYGFQCYAARQNLFYLNSDEVVYPCACMAVVLHKGTNTQKFIGGGELSSAQGHSDDINAIAVSLKRDLVATGEVGANPLICVWKVSDLSHPFCQFEQGDGTRGVGLLSFSSSNKYLSAVDISADQYIRVYDLKTQQLLFSEKGYPGHIYSLSFNPKESEFCSVGISHLFFWTKQGSAFVREKGVYGTLGNECTMSTVQYLSSTACVSAGHNGKLFLWENAHLAKVQQVSQGTQELYALAISSEIIATGGQDSKVYILDLLLHKLRIIDLSDWLRAVDIFGSYIACATRDGVITEVSTQGKKVLLETHSEGEVWSIATDPQRPNIIVTTGDDNKIKVWDTMERRCVTTCTIEALQGQNAAHRSSLLPSSQQSRAVAVSAGGHVAVGHNDGHVSIRRSSELETIEFTLTPTRAWIRCLRYSPTNDKLAVGSSDGLIAIYDADHQYSELCTFEGSYVPATAVDWSVDGRHLRACMQNGGLRFFDLSAGSAVEGEKSELRDEEWDTCTAHKGWTTLGFREMQGEEEFLTCVARTHRKDLVAVGNSWGLLDLYTLPLDSQTSVTYKAHSLEVAGVAWASDDQMLFTAGGHDLAVMQWKVISSVK